MPSVALPMNAGIPFLFSLNNSPLFIYGVNHNIFSLNMQYMISMEIILDQWDL